MHFRPAAIAMVVLLATAPSGCKRSAERSGDDHAWGRYIDQAKYEELVDRESRAHAPATLAFEHVAVVSLAHAGVDADQTIVVANGTIVAVGPSATAAVPADATRVDGTGRFVMPGLVDMHVHTDLSIADYLLDLANGVTSVREMNGSPWLLRQRDRARTNRALIPNLYVAGRILASAPLGRHATVVATPPQARAAVREQVAAGYDFIKVHNVVAPEIYAAICDEARRLGKDVVGHIPHGITVAEAVAHGQRTFEHFKSYIDDRTLTLSHEDYVAATRGAEVWNTPTFYVNRDHLRGDDARAALARPEMRYVAARTRAAWRALADEPVAPIQAGVLPMEKQIFRELMPIGARFLAGTDSGGGYAYAVRGFALHDELATMAGEGMPIADVLRTATVEPARAMRRDDFGTVEVGKRADLLLLRANPIAAIANTVAIDGVMVRGIWLPRAALDEILASLAAIAEEGAHPDLDAALATLERLRAAGVPLRTTLLGELRHELEAAGMSTARPLFEGVTAVSPED
jgi:imidazolonepropionase-like amidohydrolase